ncbi:MAG: hypothetical protein H0V48_10615, partial [Nocardioidaceae bacterium]|nr:hypothetical protein [Nocardioidaceae bacterium]
VAYAVVEALLLELAHLAEASDAGPRPRARRERVKRRAVQLMGPRVAGAGLRVYRRLRR